MEMELMSESAVVRIDMPENQPANNITDGVVKEWEGCVLGNEIAQRLQRKRKTEKVPPLLIKGPKVQSNREYYEPAVVPLGPYHHNRDDLAAAEKYKLITLEEFRLSCGTSMDSLYKKVFEVVNDARNCYIDCSTIEYDDEEFNQMMLHDGCFVLFFIDSAASSNEPNSVYGTPSLLDLRYRDRGENILNKFFNFLNYGEITNMEEKVLGENQPLHLLELYRSYFISFSCFGVGSSISSTWRRWKNIDDVDCDGRRSQIKPLASVMELKAKGIFVRCTSDETFEEEIKFHSRCGYGELKLVRRAVYFSSKAIYLNLIAYEMCPHNPNDFRVSTYIKVMKSLVIHHDDVKELRNKNTLRHNLGRDEELVKMYDEIDAPTINLHMFRQLQHRIEKHCNNKYKTWSAELINVYFSSPWKTMALLVATAILLTSFMQTYFTIRPLRDDSNSIEDIVKLLRRCVHSNPPSAPA